MKILLNKKFILFFSIILFGICLRIVMFSGYYGSDDGAYSKIAYDMSKGLFDTSYTNANIFMVRLGILLPIALLYKLFGGVNEILMVSYSFLISILSICLAFIAGKMFFDIKAGFMASIIMSVLPIDVNLATNYLPDLPAAFWAGLAILLLHHGVFKSVELRNKLILGSLSGLFFIMSWLCKETVLYLVPFVGMYLIFYIKRNKKIDICFFSCFITVLILFLAEGYYYYCKTNDFMFRFHITEKNYLTGKIFFFDKDSKLFGWKEGEYLNALIRRLFITGPQVILFAREFCYIPFLALVSIVYALLHKKKKYIFIACWFLYIVVMFNFSSSSISSYKPLVLFTRYLYPVLFPAVVSCSGFISDTFFNKDVSSSLIKIIYTTIISFVFLYNINVVAYNLKHHKINCGDERYIASILTPEDTVFTDERTKEMLHFFWKYPRYSNTIDFNGFKVSLIKKRSFVLINMKRMNFLKFHYDYKIPDFLNSLPKSWELKWEANNSKLYFVR